jgi:hypothetical protein
MTRTSWDRREARVAVSSAREIPRERRRWERSQARRESRKRGRMDEELSLPIMAAPRGERDDKIDGFSKVLGRACLLDNRSTPLCDNLLAVDYESDGLITERSSSCTDIGNVLHGNSKTARNFQSKQLLSKDAALVFQRHYAML